MPCFKPLKGWYSKTRNKETGKRSIVFKRHEGLVDLEVTVPCGRCIGCRLEYSRQWAMRCEHERKMSKKYGCCFLTLTYRDRDACTAEQLVNGYYMPEDMSLNHKHFQDFMKRLRKRYISYIRKDKVQGQRKYRETYIKQKYGIGHKIKYFMCGEYGSETERPHYHAILFDFEFEDSKPCLELKDTGHFVSKSLEELWPYGFATISPVTFESCAYVARYCVKKIKPDGTVDQNELMQNYYQKNKDDGRLTEYVKMSRKPAIGFSWYEKYKDSDCYDHDSVVVRSGITCKPPKYYDILLERENPEKLRSLKAKRKSKAMSNPSNEGRRLFDRGRVAFLKAKQKKRSKI
jgi:hypothetical protein